MERFHCEQCQRHTQMCIERCRRTHRPLAHLAERCGSSISAFWRNFSCQFTCGRHSPNTNNEFAVNFFTYGARHLRTQAKRSSAKNRTHSINLFWHGQAASECWTGVCACGSGLSLPVAWPIAKNDFRLRVREQRNLHLLIALNALAEPLAVHIREIDNNNNDDEMLRLMNIMWTSAVARVISKGVNVPSSLWSLSLSLPIPRW